ncbi:hypothetical protein JZ751_008623, partial [Albula glossodonta]
MSEQTQQEERESEKNKKEEESRIAWCTHAEAGGEKSGPPRRATLRCTLRESVRSRGGWCSTVPCRCRRCSSTSGRVPSSGPASPPLPLLRHEHRLSPSTWHLYGTAAYMEYETRSGRSGNPPSPKQSVRKNLDFEPQSTTALILEDQMKEAQKRRKQLEDRCKLEESIGNAALTWNQEILPNWETMCTSRRVRELWWQGVPPSVRGKVWSLAIGNELNITHELYNICLARAREKWKARPASVSETDSEDAGLSLADREASLELIKLDISRTFPNLCIFQKGGPYHDMLHSILGAYTCYRPDVGYVQGMSFIAAVLILNLDTADAFIAFANLLNKPCQMAFYRVDHSLMLTYFAAFEVFFEENLPKLFAHFKGNNLTPDIYLIDWIFTLYSKSLPLDLACRVWDVFCRDGDEFLFRTALGILRLYEDILTKMDFIHNAQFLTKLPEDISAEELFTAINSIQMHSKNKKWAQVLQTLQKEQERGSPVLKHSGPKPKAELFKRGRGKQAQRIKALRTVPPPLLQNKLIKTKPRNKQMSTNWCPEIEHWL